MALSALAFHSNLPCWIVASSCFNSLRFILWLRHSCLWPRLPTIVLDFWQIPQKGQRKTTIMTMMMTMMMSMAVKLMLAKMMMCYTPWWCWRRWWWWRRKCGQCNPPSLPRSCCHHPICPTHTAGLPLLKKFLIIIIIVIIVDHRYYHNVVSACTHCSRSFLPSFA